MNASRLSDLGPAPSGQERRWGTAKWPTASERYCRDCDVFTSTVLCWRCGVDLSDLPVSRGQSAPVSRRDPRPGVAAPPSGSVAAGRGSSFDSRSVGPSPLCAPQAGPTSGGV